MKRVNIRRVAAVLGFFLLWAGLEFCVRCFTEPFVQAWPMIREDRKAVEGRIDTVFLGASLFGNGIIPEAFDEILGSRSFNYATSSQSIELSQYALEDISETNPIELALIDVSVNRLIAESGDGVNIAKHVVLSHMVNPKAQWMLLKDCFPPDEIALTVLHSARDQLHFFRGTLRKRIKPSYLLDYLKFGYVPDEEYLIGSKGYVPKYDTFSDGAKLIGNDAKIRASLSDHSQQELERVIRQCREKGIAPVLISMPTTDAYMLYCDSYQALHASVKALASREGVPYLDFNLSKFRVYSLADSNFSDERHMNNSGAELFTPLLSEVVGKAQAGEDVSGYFFNSYEEMIHNVDRVAAVKLEVRNSGGGLMLVADSLHGPDIMPTYRFYAMVKAAPEKGFRMLESSADTCALDNLEPGAYKVRVEAYAAPGSNYDVYAEHVVTVK